MNILKDTLNIAMVSPYDFSFPGGVNSHITNLSRELTRIGHKVHVLAPCTALDRVNKDLCFYPMGGAIPIPYSGSIARLSLSFSQKRKIKLFLNNNSFDLIHIHEPFAPILPIWFLEHSQTINIGTFHANCEQSNLYRISRPVIKRWHNRLDGCIAVSEAAKQHISNNFPSDYKIIPNGIDTFHFSDKTNPWPDYDDDKINILFVGRLEKKKGLKYLLLAFKQLILNGHKLRLLVVGPGKLDSDCQRIIRSIDTSDLIMIGEVPYNDLPRYYSSADIFCSPSIGSESFGIVLLEAMSCGKPIIASDIDGYNKIINQGDQGILVNGNDVSSLAQAIQYLTLNPKIRARMGEIANLSAQKYSWTSVATQVETFYYQTLSQKHYSKGEACSKEKN